MPVKQLHLITEKGFFRRFIVSLVLLLSSCLLVYLHLREAAEDLFEATKLKLLKSAHRYAWWSAISILSSSCCIIQLGLNALNFGCVGFNTYLGPARPTLLAASLLLQVSCWTVAYSRPWLWVPTACSSTLSMLLTFMPEMLDRFSKQGSHTRHLAEKIANGTAEKIATATYKIESLGCASCEATIRRILDNDNRIGMHTVSARTQSAVVSILDIEKMNSIAKELSVTFGSAGFPASLASLSSKEENSFKKKNTSWSDEFLGAIVGGLLGSSCCILQLGLNILTSFHILHGIGCAGFNKYLGPLRPYLRTCTVIWMSYLWFQQLKPCSSSSPTNSCHSSLYCIDISTRNASLSWRAISGTIRCRFRNY
eukprot:GSMAST32.ASY1.ANO1.409.1 assembled CDS